MSLIEVLSLKGTVKILHALRKQERIRYSELSKIVGFATTTTRALKALESNKLVNREVLNEPYRPVAYSLTDRGKKLTELVIELEKI
jgi:DNA-binding HxlR family transcriptional regulator